MLNSQKVIYINGINSKLPFYIKEKDLNNLPLISKYIKVTKSDSLKTYLLETGRLPLFCEGNIVDTLIYEDTLYKVNIFNKCKWDRKTVILHKNYVNKYQGKYKGYNMPCEDFNKIFYNKR